MKRWAVGYFDAFNNNLYVEIVEAPTWDKAIKAHSQVGDYIFSTTDLEDAKQDFFDSDAAIDVVEIPQ